MIGFRGAGGNEVHEALPAAASAGGPPQTADIYIYIYIYICVYIYIYRYIDR